MPDWTKPMQQTFEYYIVNPDSWKDTTQLDTVKSCTIERDSESDTLGSASFSVVNQLGECYVRPYLIMIQNGIKEKFPLGTFLVQTPSSNFDGKINTVSMDAYTPLLELKETPPPLGYSILEGSNVIDFASRLTREHVRAPVIECTSDDVLYSDFVANIDDTWLVYLKDLLSYADYEYGLDELSRILFSPKQDTASLQPVWTFNDDNSSILYSDVTIEHDLYGVPNVVEVIYSSGSDQYYSRVVNDDPNSPTSTVNRGREIVYRVSNPEFSGEPTQTLIDDYAKRMLREQSTLEYSVSYKHGYCPVRLGDCVRLNYTRAGLENIKAKVVSQTIECQTGCYVSEKAVFTTELWGW